MDVVEEGEAIGCGVEISLAKVILCVVRMQVLQVASVFGLRLVVSLVFSLDWPRRKEEKVDVFFLRE